jgi:hypothetical protein
VAQIDAAEFPLNLVHVQASPQVTEIDCLLNELGEQTSPASFQIDNACTVPTGKSVAPDQACQRRRKNDQQHASYKFHYGSRSMTAIA